MLAQFSIWPLDDPHMSRNMADVAEILEKAGVRYEVGPMGTTLEGEWQNVIDAIHACHQAVRESRTRVLTTITIDDDATRALNMEEATAKVEARRQEMAP